MKTGRSRKYYLMEAVLILFNILINLIIFAVPLAVNQIINRDFALKNKSPCSACEFQAKQGISILGIKLLFFSV